MKILTLGLVAINNSPRIGPQCASAEGLESLYPHTYNIILDSLG
jgi:hypothetical protein